MEIEYYQTENALETIAIIKDEDGSISLGIARAGKQDVEEGRISKLTGMDIAYGRAVKARVQKGILLKKNYLRGLHAVRV